MRYFAPLLKVLRKFEEVVAFVQRSLGGQQLLLSGGHSVITPDNRDDESARGDFRSRARGGGGSRDGAIIRNTCEGQKLMQRTLADVLQDGIVGNEAHKFARPIALGIEILRVVIHVGEQCVARQALVPAGKAGVGQCGLKLRAVLPGPRKSIFQRQAECCWRRRRCLLRMSCWRGGRGSRRFLPRGHSSTAQQKGSNRDPRQSEDAAEVHRSQLLCK